MLPRQLVENYFRQAGEASRKEAECRCFRPKAYVGTPMGEKTANNQNI